MGRVEEEFDWDEANGSHLALHGVLPHEAEEVVMGNPLILSTEQRQDELRRRELGCTKGGRVLVIVSIARGYRIRVVTGWPADRPLRELWKQMEGRP